MEPAPGAGQAPPSLYPQIYRPPPESEQPQGKAGSSASLSSAGTAASGASGSPLGGGGGGASIVLAVDSFCWEVLPTSQTLKARLQGWRGACAV